MKNQFYFLAIIACLSILSDANDHQISLRNGVQSDSKKVEQTWQALTQLVDEDPTYLTALWFVAIRACVDIKENQISTITLYDHTEHHRKFKKFMQKTKLADEHGTIDQSVCDIIQSSYTGSDGSLVQIRGMVHPDTTKPAELYKKSN